MQLLQMAMRQEMRERTSAALQKELEDIDHEAQAFREATRERMTKTALRNRASAKSMNASVTWATGGEQTASVQKK